jgi:hypothetical protein
MTVLEAVLMNYDEEIYTRNYSRARGRDQLSRARHLVHSGLSWAALFDDDISIWSLAELEQPCVIWLRPALARPCKGPEDLDRI